MINRLRCAWLSTHIRKHLNIPPFSSRSTLLLGSTDPATGRPLRDQRIVPNPALRAIIAACNPSAHPPPGPWLNCYIDQESCSELVCESRTNHIDVIWLSHKMNDAYFRHFTKASTRFILRWHDEMQPTLHQGACLRVGFALVTTGHVGFANKSPFSRAKSPNFETLSDSRTSHGEELVFFRTDSFKSH